MTVVRRIVFLAYDDFELLDVSGAMAVFSAANKLSGGILYQLKTVSHRGGQVVSTSGLPVITDPLTSIRPNSRDTILVPGALGKPLQEASNSPAIRRFLRAAAKRAERYGSICTGAFVLAAADLLDERQVCTHWWSEAALKSRFPKALLQQDALYSIDGRLWTSAGVTSGIDMALAMIEVDHSADLKFDVARQLVVFAHRPGSQTQFADLLQIQTRSGTKYRELIDWLKTRIGKPTKVSQMAEFARESERSFQRRFKETTGESPGRYFENLRLDHARSLLEIGTSINKAAQKVGYRSIAAFRSAFSRRFGISPKLHKQLTGN